MANAFTIRRINILLKMVLVMQARVALSTTTQREPTRVLQQTPVACFEGVLECPRFWGEQDWADRTQEKCCPGQPDLAFHCQDHAGRIIKACLPVIQCPAGTIPILHEETDSGSVYAYLKCMPCPDENTFETNPKKSYEYQHNYCPEEHKRCHPDDNTVLARAGNSTHDATCHCDWEKGYAPVPNSADCRSPTGFGRHSHCGCYFQSCGDDKTLNNEYECVTRVSDNEDTSKSLKPETQGPTGNSQVHGFGPVGHALPPQQERDGDLWYLPIVVVGCGVAVFPLYKVYRQLYRCLMSGRQHSRGGRRS
ncbi:uncharacterized protein [Littorina saxatilis]|uniref:uncharacterized protein isoform X2 n=1 Tax=Littorina saxatilis TaxID=31220 RepID=UPI0038B420E1